MDPNDPLDFCRATELGRGHGVERKRRAKLIVYMGIIGLTFYDHLLGYGVWYTA